MTPQEKDRIYHDLKRYSETQDIHMDVHHALRHARWQALRLPESHREHTLESIDDALHQHWQQMMSLQHVIGRVIKEAYDAE